MAINELTLDRRIFLDGTRLEKPFQRFLIAQDSFVFAINALDGTITEAGDGTAIYLSCVVGLDIRLPTRSNFLLAAGRVKLAQSWFMLVSPKQRLDALNPENRPLMPLASLLNDSATIQFVIFYDNHWDWFWKASNTTRDKITPVWAFARVVRNAVSHGNRVTIDDANFKPVSWHSVTYGPAENGQSVVGKDIHAPDILALMVEMDHELEDCGYGQSLRKSYCQEGIVSSLPHE